MSKYYILSVESFQDTFAILDASTTFTLDFITQNSNNVIKQVEPGDYLLIYRKEPLSGINLCIKAMPNSSKGKRFQKFLEMSNFVSKSEISFHKNLEINELTEITQDEFSQICRKMVSKIDEEFEFLNKICTYDLKEQFKLYIKNMLGLKSLRQVSDLERISDDLIEAGVLEKGVYYISDVEEYRVAVEQIKNSTEYQKYKTDRKEKNPMSGLPCDQGMSNYEKFLIYLSQNKTKSNRAIGGINKIFYGIPGCGKSYSVDKEIKRKYPEKEKFNSNVFRTTFYLDYSNSDFIGQLIPKVREGKVTYEPNFGPFTKALKRAYETDEMIYLVIEEINRGNAAAIFGDLFQLLDRLDQEKATKRNDGSKVGDSEYPVTNTFLEDYLGIKEGAVIIPSNLTIYATMNTSDQNVFPLDTAFKRRWQMEKVTDDIDKSTYANYYVPQYSSVDGGEKPITWAHFLKEINKFILDSDEGYNLEDKQIGSYFVTDNILVKDSVDFRDDNRANQFNYKVIDYIWSDVAKFDRKRWINIENEKPRSLDSLIERLKKYGISKTFEAFKNEDEE